MWNMTYLNRICNEHDRFRDHKKHLNNVISVRSNIDNSTPYKPLFLVNKNNRVHNEVFANIKINYENQNLLDKIKFIESKPSKYHPSKIEVKDCPAYRKTNFIRNTTNKKITKENEVR